MLQIRQATVALAKLITMDAELSAAASSKAAPDTRTGAAGTGRASDPGSGTGTGTGMASDAHTTASPRQPVNAGSVLQTGNAAEGSLGGGAVTAEAEALAEVGVAALTQVATVTRALTKYVLAPDMNVDPDKIVHFQSRSRFSFGMLHRTLAILGIMLAEHRGLKP